MSPCILQRLLDVFCRRCLSSCDKLPQARQLFDQATTILGESRKNLTHLPTMETASANMLNLAKGLCSMVLPDLTDNTISSIALNATLPPASNAVMDVQWQNDAHSSSSLSVGTNTAIITVSSGPSIRSHSAPLQRIVCASVRPGLANSNGTSDR